MRLLVVILLVITTNTLTYTLTSMAWTNNLSTPGDTFSFVPYSYADIKAIVSQKSLRVGRPWQLTHRQLDSFFSERNLTKQVYGVDVTRAVQTFYLADVIRRRRITTIDKLLIFNSGGIENNIIVPLASDVYNYEYTKDNESGDAHDMRSYTEYDFDFVLFPQTTEHLYNPVQVFQQINKHMRIGGLLFTHQPWINRPHMSPIHFSQHTGYGMSAILAQAGFRVVEYKDWGNNEYTIENLVNRRWPPYTRMKNISSERNRYAQTMILAEKINERQLFKTDFL